jgi:PilZ domain
MSAAATRAPVRAELTRRRTPRYAAALPVDVTVLRSGVPRLIPGRSFNLSPGGVGVALAGELRLGELVGLELRVPSRNHPLQAKAVVRHRRLLACGLQLLSLSAEQMEMIQLCANHVALSTPEAPLPGDAPLASAEESAAASREMNRRSRHPILRRTMLAALAMVLAGGALGWWHWNQAWKELESRVPAAQAPTSR